MSWKQHYSAEGNTAPVQNGIARILAVLQEQNKKQANQQTETVGLLPVYLYSI